MPKDTTRAFAAPAEFAAARPTINQHCDLVIAAAGVGAVAKPIIDGLRRKLDTPARLTGPNATPAKLAGKICVVDNE